MTPTAWPTAPPATCLLCDKQLVRLHGRPPVSRLAEDWLCHGCRRDPVGHLAALAMYEWHKGNALASASSFQELADRVRLGAWGLRQAAEEAMRWEAAATGRPRDAGAAWVRFARESDAWLVCRRQSLRARA